MPFTIPDNVEIPNIKERATEWANKKFMEGAEKAVTDVLGVSAPVKRSNAQMFLSSEGGQQFLNNVENLRAIYELSLGEGKSDAEQIACLKKAFPEQMAEVEKYKQTDPDIAQATMDNLARIMVYVHENYPKLATSTDYVIKPITTKEKDPETGEETEQTQITYVKKKDLSEDDKKKVWPQTTGQYVQAIANDLTEAGYPVNMNELFPAVAKATHVDKYGSRPSQEPLWDAMFQPRTGDMQDDDELRSKAGNWDDAVRGDLMELGLTLVDPTKALKGISMGGRFLRGLVKTANALPKIKKVDNVANGIGKGMQWVDKLDDKAQVVLKGGQLPIRMAKGAGLNVGQTVATDLAGQGYDKLYGTDRGDSALSTDNWKGFAIDAFAGALGSIISNPAKATEARAKLWDKIEKNKHGWGGELLKAREKMGQPWQYAEDIDLNWMSQYLNGEPVEDFARKVYEKQNLPKIHLDGTATPIENRNARIDQANALIEEKNKGIRAENKAMYDNYNEVVKYNNEQADRIYGADQPDIEGAGEKLDKAMEDNRVATAQNADYNTKEADLAQEQVEQKMRSVNEQQAKVDRLPQTIQNEKEAKMRDDWNKLSYYGPFGGEAERTTNASKLSDPYFQQPYPEHQPKFVAKQDIKLKDGSTLRVGELDGKPATQRIDAKGSVGKVVPISNKEAVNLNADLDDGNKFYDTSKTRNVDTSKKGRIVDYKGTKGIPTVGDEFSESYQEALTDIANKWRMEDAVTALGNRKQALNKATADYNNAVEKSLKEHDDAVTKATDEYNTNLKQASDEYNSAVNQSIKPQQKGWMSKEEYQLRNPKAPEHKPQIPTLKSMELEADKIKDGQITPALRWYCERMYKSMGYSSAEDMLSKLPMKSRVALANGIEMTAKDQGWNKFGAGSGKEFSVGDWNKMRNQRAPKSEQTSATKEEAYANDADKYQHDLMTNFYKFPEGTPQSTYDKYKNLETEYALRVNQGKNVGSFAEDKRKLIPTIARGIGGYGVEFLGRDLGKADYNVRPPYIPISDGWEMSTAQKKK